MIFRLAKVCPLLPRTMYAFAQLQTLSKVAQKALWADAIIREIMNKPANKNTSLSAHLLQMANPSKDYEFDEACKEEVLGLFKNGVMLDPEVYNS